MIKDNPRHGLEERRKGGRGVRNVNNGETIGMGHQVHTVTWKNVVSREIVSGIQVTPSLEPTSPQPPWNTFLT